MGARRPRLAVGLLSSLRNLGDYLHLKGGARVARVTLVSNARLGAVVPVQHSGSVRLGFKVPGYLQSGQFINLTGVTDKGSRQLLATIPTHTFFSPATAL